MRIETAIGLLRDGHAIARSGWNGKNQYVEMQVPDKNSKMTQPYAYITNAQGDCVPWVPSQGDLFAEDWEVMV